MLVKSRNKKIVMTGKVQFVTEIEDPLMKLREKMMQKKSVTPNFIEQNIKKPLLISPNFELMTLRQNRASEKRSNQEIIVRKKHIALNCKWDIIRAKRKIMTE